MILHDFYQPVGNQRVEEEKEKYLVPSGKSWRGIFLGLVPVSVVLWREAWEQEEKELEGKLLKGKQEKRFFNFLYRVH